MYEIGNTANCVRTIFEYKCGSCWCWTRTGDFQQHNMFFLYYAPRIVLTLVYSSSTPYFRKFDAHPNILFFHQINNNNKNSCSRQRFTVRYSETIFFPFQVSAFWKKKKIVVFSQLLFTLHQIYFLRPTNQILSIEWKNVCSNWNKSTWVNWTRETGRIYVEINFVTRNLSTKHSTHTRCQSINQFYALFSTRDA